MGGDKENLAHGYPGNAKYTGVLVAIVTGGMVLLGFFLDCGISAFTED